MRNTPLLPLAALLTLAACAVDEQAPSTSDDALLRAGPDCPTGFDFTLNIDAEGFCLAEVPTGPATADIEADCVDFDQGAIGYTFTLVGNEVPTCPEGAAFWHEGDTGGCIWENLALPPGAEAYCDDIGAGIIGYTWQLPENLPMFLFNFLQP